MTDLMESRAKIDRIDKEIVSLFEQRMEAARDVAEYKRKTGKKVLDAQREKEKLEKLSALVSSELDQRAMEELFSQIMSISRKYQYTLLGQEENGFEQRKSLPKTPEIKVCFLKTKDSYAEQAMRHCFGTKVQAVPEESVRKLMKVIQDHQAEYGVLRVKNTETERMTAIYDLLMEYDNYIIAEYVFPAKSEGVRKEDEKAETVDPAYYIVVSGKKEFLEHAGKICVCFEIPDSAGSLYKMLSHIAYNKLNMIKIESAPRAGQNSECRFFAEFEGCITEDAVRNTLIGMKEEASGWKMIGNIADV